MNAAEARELTERNRGPLTAAELAGRERLVRFMVGDAAARGESRVDVLAYPVAGSGPARLPDPVQWEGVAANLRRDGFTVAAAGPGVATISW